MQSDSVAVILAAGGGKRMGGDQPKGLKNIGGKTMLEHLVSSLIEATHNKPIVVVGYKQEEIRKSLKDAVIYAEQKEQLGTANALLAAKSKSIWAKRVAVFYGDHPLVSVKTIKELLKRSEKSGAKITLTSALLPDFENDNKVFLNFGRIIRKNGKIKKISEYKDANEKERKVMEINPGYYVFSSDWLWPHLEKIKNDNLQKEYLLTDLIKMATLEGVEIESIKIEPREAMGANSPEELEILRKNYNVK